MNISSLVRKLFHNPNDTKLQAQLAQARLSRSVELNLIVDDEDRDLLSSYTWSLQKSNHVQTNVFIGWGHPMANSGQIGPDGKKGHYKTTLHVMVEARKQGCQPWDLKGLHVDHIIEGSKGKLDCRRDNLQALNPKQHSQKTQRHIKSLGFTCPQDGGDR